MPLAGLYTSYFES